MPLTLRERRDQSRFEVLQDFYETKLKRRIATARNKFVRAVSENYDPNAKYERELFQLQLDIREVLAEQYTRIIPIFGQRQLDNIRSVKRDPKYTGYFERLIQSWTAERSLSSATLVSNTAMEDVRKAISVGLADGEGNAAIARRIRRLTALSGFRAATVARTETHQASLYAADEIGRQAEVDFGVKLMKVWVPALDERTRDSHREMANHAAVNTDGTFLVGGERMARPGDPNASAANTINCRCSIIHKEVEYESF